MKNSAEIGHYIADAHVPLHASSNHNGQLTNQLGIHAFWESRVPELLADKQFDFFIGKAEYIKNPGVFILGTGIGKRKRSRFSFDVLKKNYLTSSREIKNILSKTEIMCMVRQYSSDYTIAYNNKLNGMVERRMRQAIFAVASFWYTAWVNAGQPDLSGLVTQYFLEATLKILTTLTENGKAGKLKGEKSSMIVIG